MQQVQYVQKDKAISGGGASYKAVTHDQLISVIRFSLVEHGIVVEPKQTSGDIVVKRDLAAVPPVKMALYSGNYDVFFVNMDKPEERTCVSVEAHAQDNGDKAPGKAMTYAVKTAILKQFLLETGENEESRADDAQMIARRKSLTRADLAKYIIECGYTSEQVASGLNVDDINKADPKEAFDMVTFWKQQQQ